MAARKRPATPASAARLGALLLLNLAALAVLWRTVGGPEQALALDQPAAVVPAPPATGQRLPPVLRDAHPTSSHAPSHALERRGTLRALRAIVSGALAQAESVSKRRVRAGQVRVAVHVREIGAPGVELALDADRAQIPASNMKLVTTAAALVLLGPGWHFTTVAEAAGELRDGELHGDLVLRAGGDPLFDPEARGSVDHLLAPLIAQLSGAGLRRVSGDLVLDEGRFEAPAAPPGWPAEGQRWAEYCALAGGFSANRGCLTASVSPTRPGQAARVEVEPRHNGLARSVDVETSAKGQLIVRLDARGASGVVVRGSVPMSVSRWSDAFAHPDPVELFGHALAGALAEAGITLEGGLRRQRDLPSGTPLGTLSSPLSGVLVPINTDSNNGVADQLFLALGQAVGGEGTRATAARVTAEALERLGVPSAGFAQVDGSGLARGNRVSARQMSALIAAVIELPAPAPELFVASLAVGGRSGTLSTRMREPELADRVYAKTGFIGGVSALSGLVASAAGPRYAFSILVEYPVTDGLNTSCWKPMQDRIVALLAGLQP